ncbi:yeats family-domain-containing protein [Radiomyces spectabilis]|uniref:yeats family-domain-containing protein n=1 Tax=Radiomyces spectabilis TaxID=64574 RepID=UPI00221EEBAF|nr:yeats family-domain-containing protein [Radiomyces spectabilis]KAI8371754.1 yeats family-domain-containing protein [Radiomyces spectabilis]
MSSNKRIKGISVTRPFYFGNIAMPLTGKKAADSDHTHKWTVMVRGINNEDLSYYIKKVVFKLHETYANPLRTVEQPPFEVSETGWGEFEIMIKIHFQAVTSEKPVTLYHHLRLHPYEDDPSGKPWPADRPVSSFIYDELIFNEPTEQFYQILSEHNALTSNLPAKKPNKDNPTVPQFSVQLEQEELERLDHAQREVNMQIMQLRQQMAAIEQDRYKS